MRLQFDLTEDQAQHMENLMQEAGLSTKKDLLNNALTLLAWAIEEVGEGNTIASIDEEGQRYRELRMPALSHVALQSGRGRTPRGA